MPTWEKGADGCKRSGGHCPVQECYGDEIAVVPSSMFLVRNIKKKGDFMIYFLYFFDLVLPKHPKDAERRQIITTCQYY